jgi:uncharacterized delta-60 repeat protein
VMPGQNRRAALPAHPHRPAPLPKALVSGQTLNTLAVQADGMLLVGGGFTNLGGQARSRIGRLNPDGTLDNTFNPGASSAVNTLALQADGRIVVGGGFTNLGGQARSNLGRLNADGTLDGAFNPGANSTVYSLTLQAEGKVLVGGAFTTLAGVARTNLARLNNTEPATQSLSYSDSGITWLRGGTSPDVWRTSFELATDGGGWLSLGSGERVAGGWRLGAVTLPSNYTVRASGQVVGGWSGASGWFVQSYLGIPAIEQHPRNLTNNAGTTATYSVRAVGAGPLSYQWFKGDGVLADGPNLAGSTTPTLTLSNVLRRDASGYSTVVSNPQGSVTSSAAILQVIDPCITTQPVSLQRDVGRDASFSVAAAGTSHLIYQWFKNGTAIFEQTSAQLIVTNVQTADAGGYSVLVSNHHGMVTSAVVTLAVNGALLSEEFTPAVKDAVYAIALSVGGGILLGGDFTSVDGQMQKRLARLNADGSRDAAFGADASGTVYALGVQPDGKTVVAGKFGKLRGMVRNYLGRLNVDSTVDTGFNPAPNGIVYALAVQPDGAVLLGGAFTSVAGQVRNRLARLNADGTLDAAFNPSASGAVNSLALQADGRLLIGGAFTSVASQGRNRLARFNADGTLDTAFNPGANGTVNSLVVQTDGRVVVGGAFTNVAGQVRNRLARLNADGTLDLGFNPGGNDAVNSLVLQADGRILVGGAFTTLAGQQRSRLARLNADGTLDPTFNPGANSNVTALALQPDGGILVGGSFAMLGNQACACFGRLTTGEAAPQALLCDASAITWLRGGICPEVWRTTFEVCTNGSDWVLIGSGTRIPGGWQLSATGLPAEAMFRARGFLTAGYGNASGAYVEAGLGAPFLANQAPGVSQRWCQPVRFSIQASGSEPLSYQWLADGLPVPGGTGRSIEVAATPALPFVGYQVVVSNTLGSATSDVAHATSPSLVSWGDNIWGQIAAPPNLADAVAISAGSFHSLALTSDGRVTAWGKNRDGQAAVPITVSNIVGIAAGGNHSLALRQDGAIIGWGRDWDGQATAPPHATNVIALAAGWEHSLALCADGTVLAWGNNDSSQTQVSFMAMGAMAIAAGSYHNLALRHDGRVAAWGDNSVGQTLVPESATNIVGIAAGYWHSLALRNDGTVLAWGDDSRSQCQVPSGLTNVASIAAGYDWSVAVLGNGQLVGWGRGSLGADATPSCVHDVASLALGEYHGLALPGGAPRFGPQPAQLAASAGQSLAWGPAVRATPDTSYQWFVDGAPVSGGTNRVLNLRLVSPANAGNYVLVASNAYGMATSAPIALTVQAWQITAVGAWGDEESGQCDVPDAAREVCAVSAGNFHSLALTRAGQVLAWGKGRDGQTSPPLSATNVVAVAAGGDHSLALRSDGTVVGWGRNWDGQISIPESATNVVAIASGWAHSAALRADGTVLVWGNDEYSQTQLSVGGLGVVAIAAGYYHSAALRRDGTVACWGDSTFGQCNVPHSATNVVAVAAGWGHTLALRADGTVVSWGDNSYGQSAVPPGITNAVAIAAGYAQSMAILMDGTVVAWGTGLFGSAAVPAGLGNAAAISCGEQHSLFLMAIGAPSFGTGLDSCRTFVGGQLILPGLAVSGMPASYDWFSDGRAVGSNLRGALCLPSVAASDAGSLVLVASNAFGSTTSAPTVLTVESQPQAATAVGAWGNASHGQFAVPQPHMEICAIAAGNFHNLALTRHGQVAGWGEGRDGQTTPPASASNVVAIAAGGAHSLALRANGTVVGWGRNWDGQVSVPAAATNVVSIAGGWAHSVALRADGSVLVWGNNYYRQAQAPPGMEALAAIAAGYYHNVALTPSGRVICWGDSSFGQCHVPPDATNVVAIAAGWGHTLALRADATVLTWGDNSYGQATVPPGVSNVVAIAAGYAQSVAVQADGTVVAWGDGLRGSASAPVGLKGVAAIACGEDHTLFLLANGSPIIAPPVDSCTSFVGGQLTVPRSVVSSLPTRYQWYRDNNALALATNAVLIVTNLQSSESGAYSLRASNGSDEVVSRGTAVAVQDGPWVTLNPQHQVAVPSQPFCLVANGGGATPLSFEWRFNGGSIAEGSNLHGAHTKALCFDGVLQSNAGEYQFVVRNPRGSVTSSVVKLTVTALAVWGDDNYGQKDIPLEATDLVAIAAGGAHNLALRSDGRVVAWGGNSFGQTAIPTGTGTAIAIAAGSAHSLALRANGTVFAWGDNSAGQAAVPARATNVVAIAAGGNASAALRADGSLVLWGSQSTVPGSWQNLEMVAVGGSVAAIQSDGTVVSIGGPTKPATVSSASALAVGGKHVLAIVPPDRLVAWGDNSWGQTNVPAGTNTAIAVGAGEDTSLAITRQGNVLAWGDNRYGQAQVPPLPLPATQVAAGESHALALLDAGTDYRSGPSVGLTNQLGAANAFFTLGKRGLGTSYQWQLNGVPLPGFTGPSLSLAALHWTNSGTYRLVVSNANGVTAGPEMVLTVQRQTLRFSKAQRSSLTGTAMFQTELEGAGGTGPLVVFSSGDLKSWYPILTNPPAIGTVALESVAMDSASKAYRAVEMPAAGPIRLTPLSGSTPPWRLEATGFSATAPIIIQASSDLATWKSIFTNPPTIGPLSFWDYAPDAQQTRYYRALESQ